MTIITPYLPKEAELAIKDWLRNHPAAFVMANDRGDNWDDTYCRNCAGMGIISIRFADKGPYKFVPQTDRAITWFDGDGITRKGWYILEPTRGFTCPHCKGEAHFAVAPGEQPKDPERKYHKPEEISNYLQDSKRMLDSHSKESAK